MAPRCRAAVQGGVSSIFRVANVAKALDGIKLPAGYSISQEGDAKQGAKRLINAWYDQTGVSKP
jgi:hypothetical protein